MVFVKKLAFQPRGSRFIPTARRLMQVSSAMALDESLTDTEYGIGELCVNATCTRPDCQKVTSVAKVIEPIYAERCRLG